MSDLDLITKGLAGAYKEWKSGEKSKNKFRDDFFQAIEDEVSSSPMAEKIATIGAADEASARSLLSKQYPSWTVDEIRETDGVYQAILVENPQYVGFTYVNKDLGLAFQKQVSSGSVFVDDERLAEEDPELYEQVTYVPTERKLRDLESLPSELIAKLSEYIYEGKPTVKLAAPRKVKEEEVE